MSFVHYHIPLLASRFFSGESNIAFNCNYVDKHPDYIFMSKRILLPKFSPAISIICCAEF